MPSSSTAIHTIDATTVALQKELPQLEQLQQDLEKELAAVSERVLSVRAALTALLALADTPAPRAVQETEPEPKPEPQPEPATTGIEAAVEASDTVAPDESGSVPAPRKATTSRSTRERKAAPQARGRKERPSAKKSRVTAAAQETPPATQGSSGLTEQVAAVLTQSPDSPMRARDVAKALGRDSSTSAINTVRSTLDRLVATSRAARAGRGLYQAPAS
ncbi:hypothetical protein ABZY16_39900 [Streptomyces sp. NPDC006553]|uniref:hypothetical protein n=1 Tax=unclassified Streptomyces TaxID=2593676 RepID=UPI0022590884|nr:hypothetical protein [Streptomyces sp. NBC_00233]MCX5232496.1 hypothetical protein [Streptomyces sp. NBC_00233]